MRSAGLALCAVLAIACNARLGATSQNNGGDTDASGNQAIDSGGSGSGSDVVPADASPDANACPSGRVVYLNFGGQTLTQATTSDATQNEAVWVGMSGGGQTTGTLAQWRPGVSDRTTQIQDVVTGLTTKFAAIAPTITFVTTRPAAGPYVMIGFGGARTDVGVPYTDTVNRLDCGDATKSDVGWVFEAVDTTEHAITSAAGALAFGMGATGTTDPDDCMCGWLTNCTSSDNPCTFSATADAQLDCTNETDPQNDVKLLQAFCN